MGETMSKRFTESDKWKYPWFEALPMAGKLAWFYIWDDCDHRGVWIPNVNRLSYAIGAEVSIKQIESWFYPNLIQIHSDSYLNIDFVLLQYPEKLNPDNNAHRSVYAYLSKFRAIVAEAPRGGEVISILGPPRGAQDKDTDTDQDQDQDQDREQEKDKEKEKTQKFDFETIWAMYPRREGKSQALNRFSRMIKSQEDYEKLTTAVYNYREELKRNGTEKQHMRLFTTFLGTPREPAWGDWVNPEPSESFKKPKILPSGQIVNNKPINLEEAS